MSIKGISEIVGTVIVTCPSTEEEMISTAKYILDKKEGIIAVLSIVR